MIREGEGGAPAVEQTQIAVCRAFVVVVVTMGCVFFLHKSSLLK